MLRHGAVIVFKQDCPPEQAAAALERIADCLDLPEEVTEYEFTPESEGRATQQVAGSHQRPFKMADKVQEFDDQYGGPVWYIP